jgi:hypothetical protein
MGLLREMRRISSGQDSDCFLQIGVYRVCEATLIVSNYGNLMLLMAQAIVSRMLVPGKSNFVSASVRLVLEQSLLTIFVCESLGILPDCSL